MWHDMVLWMRQGVTSSSALGHPENRIFLDKLKDLGRHHFFRSFPKMALIS
jgi:hypothetical protein